MNPSLYYMPGATAAPDEQTAPHSQHQGHGRKSSKASSKADKHSSKGAKEGGGKWINKMTGWLATSEPSTQALLQHQREAFQNAGIPLADPSARAHAHSKLNSPIGEIPPDATMSTAGPDPEEVLKQRKKEQQRRKERSSRKHSHSAHSVSAGSMTATATGSSSFMGPRSASAGSSSSMYSGKETSSVSSPTDYSFPYGGWNR
ncbi:hypothetical protein QBC35DRAFT_199993 [Podospora australis]|uniref:Uncharacterized protein n=1 Tax=Podospora australis TaxID=1536484 RepID=A0AAN6X3I6_9PEZI|nr:hypothetical protein QBC35DRAFT_199993 [Podospora australis]